MTLSEVFYEAACRMSDTPREEYGIGFGNYEFSCHAVSMVDIKSCCYHESPASGEYAELMIAGEYLAPRDVENAAADISWHPQDYRTFMLLMASEAVK